MSNSISYLLLMYEDNNRHFCNCFKRFWGILGGCNTIASPLRFLFTHLKVLKLKLLQLVFFTFGTYYRVMLIKKENLINFFKLNKWTFF